MRHAYALLFPLICVLASPAWAQDDPEAQNGRDYPIGTVLRGVCKPAPNQWEYTVWTTFEFRDEERARRGLDPWIANAPAVDSDTCTAIFNDLGRYRFVVTTGRWARVEKREIRAEFRISAPTPCARFEIRAVRALDKDGRARNVTQQERQSIGLDGQFLMTGRDISTPRGQMVEIEFADSSIMRLADGSKTSLTNCSDLDDKSRSFWFTLWLGNVWMKVTKLFGGETYQIRTERGLTGVRGTSFSITYDLVEEKTSVVVEDGVVWLRNRYGIQKTIDIHAGEAGTQLAMEPPVLVKR